MTVRLARAADLAAVAADLRAIPGVREAEVDEHEFSVTAFPSGGASVLTAVSSLATERRWPVEQLRLEAGRLDEVFRHITTGAPGAA